jgi:hypothetical protein
LVEEATQGGDVKVSVPFDFDMDQRFGISLETTGELRLATRDECRAWVQHHIGPASTVIRGTVKQIKAQFNVPQVPIG